VCLSGIEPESDALQAPAVTDLARNTYVAVSGSAPKPKDYETFVQTITLLRKSDLYQGRTGDLFLEKETD
jgi:hypothetical protein